jgi:hypothetical protein
MRDRKRSKLEVARFRAYRSAALSLGTGNVVTFDAVEWDPLGMVQASKVVVPPGQDGEWEFEGGIFANVVLTADRYWIARVYKNGVADTPQGNTIFQRGTGATVISQTSGRILMKAGDYFELVLLTDNGSTALAVGKVNTYLSGKRVS